MDFSLFYLRFIEKGRGTGKNDWTILSQQQAYKIWCAYAFENICLKHVGRIKDALKIGGVHSVHSSFAKKGTATESGTQIDLLIDRNDQIINVVELKFYNKAFTIDKNYAARLREKLRIFQETTKTRKQLLLTFVTTFGLKQNKHSLGFVTGDLTLDDLFEDAR